ncbi:MAG: hypothetical protein QOJ64_317 [Acidobacteriota bacterium]|jgi:hypothetical protein|nr:hypothetical protein [Acidobacteriota bacterium]
MFKQKSQLWLAVMFFGILASYLLLLTTNYYWDGIFFAQVIEDAPGLDASLLHPNHLLYNVVGYLAFRLARILAPQARAVEVLQISNCIISAMTAYVLFRILRICFKSLYLSVTLTLLFAFSATWWKFSTDADSYILSVFFLLVSSYLILPSRKPKPFWLAVSFSLSMLFHQLAIFFFPVAVLGLLMQTHDEPMRHRLGSVLKFAFGALLVTLPMFCYSFYLVTGSWALKPFLLWITTFSPENGFTFNAWNNLGYTLRGHSRLFVGGRLSFLRDLMGPLMDTLVGFLFVIAGIFFYKLISNFKEVRIAARTALTDDGRLKQLRILCCVWIAVYLVFLFFFIPQNTFYRLFYAPAIIVLVGTFLAPYELSQQHMRRYRTALFVAMVIVANLTFSAYPYARVSTNPPLELALKMNQVWKPGTIVYFATWNSDNALVKYFNPSVTWVEANQKGLEAELGQSIRNGRPVWIDTTLIQRMQEIPEGKGWLETHTIHVPDYEVVNSKYRLQFFKINPESFAPELAKP